MEHNPTYKEVNTLIPKTITGAEFEDEYVKQVYSHIATDFSRTRYSHWDVVYNFVMTIEPNSKMLDMGCGNGKNLSIRTDISTVAIDTCEKFIEIVKEKYPDTVAYVSSAENTGLESASFDYIISIAVIHHLSSETKRIQMIGEIIRLLKIGGKCLLTAWATEQTCTSTLSKSKKISDTNDYLIPWTNHKDKTISYRFYHLFEKDEFDVLVNNFSNVKIISSRYEEDNWIIEFKKIQ